MSKVIYYVGYKKNFIIDVLRDSKNKMHSNVAEHTSGMIPFLKEKLKNDGIQFIDYYQREKNKSPLLVVHLDISPDYRSIIQCKGKHIAVLQECEVVNQLNWKQEIHHNFDKILTWMTDLNNNNYVKIYTIQGYSNKNVTIKSGLTHKKKLVTIISSNKRFKHAKQLSSEKIECIKWFEKNKPNDFDLYGYGWLDLPAGCGWVVKILKNIRPLSRLLAHKYMCYRGVVNKKKKTLEEYKFNIVYENAQLINGYVTEKIFDSFVAGTVPVYKGAPNIHDIVPRNCFIDLNEFESFDSLYNFMNSMTDKEYLGYQENIQLFITSKKGLNYTNEKYHDILYKCIKSVIG